MGEGMPMSRLTGGTYLNPLASLFTAIIFVCHPVRVTECQVGVIGTKYGPMQGYMLVSVFE